MVVFQAGGANDLRVWESHWLQTNPKEVAENARLALDILVSSGAQNILLVGVIDTSALPYITSRESAIFGDLAALVTKTVNYNLHKVNAIVKF